MAVMCWQELVIRAWLPGARASDVDLIVQHRTLTLKVICFPAFC